MGAYLEGLAAACTARQARFGAAARVPERSSESVLAAGMKAHDLISRRLDENATNLVKIQKRLDALERRIAAVLDALRIEPSEPNDGRSGVTIAASSS